jgi:hypothetical protein
VALAVVPVPQMLPEMLKPVDRSKRLGPSLLVVGDGDYDRAGDRALLWACAATGALSRPELLFGLATARATGGAPRPRHSGAARLNSASLVTGVDAFPRLSPPMDHRGELLHQSGSGRPLSRRN